MRSRLQIIIIIIFPMDGYTVCVRCSRLCCPTPTTRYLQGGAAAAAAASADSAAPGAALPRGWRSFYIKCDIYGTIQKITLLPGTR